MSPTPAEEGRPARQPADAAHTRRVRLRAAAAARGVPLATIPVTVAYQQLENHVLNPVIMSRTVNVNPLLVLLSILVGASIGDWLGGLFGSFVAALLSIPAAGALQVVARELWLASEWHPPADGAAPGDPGDQERYPGEDGQQAPACSVTADQRGSSGAAEGEG